MFRFIYVIACLYVCVYVYICLCTFINTLNSILNRQVNAPLFRCDFENEYSNLSVMVGYHDNSVFPSYIEVLGTTITWLSSRFISYTLSVRDRERVSASFGDGVRSVRLPGEHTPRKIRTSFRT